MLSRKFFGDALNHGIESIDNNNASMEADKKRCTESTSTAISFLSSDEPSPRDVSTDSPQMLRHRLNMEQEFDFGIPGTYR